MIYSPDLAFLIVSSASHLHQVRFKTYCKFFLQNFFFRKFDNYDLKDAFHVKLMSTRCKYLKNLQSLNNNALFFNIFWLEFFHKL